MFYGKKVEVRQLGNNNWAVVNPFGDEECGTWVICECFWEQHARNIAKLINEHFDKPERKRHIDMDVEEVQLERIKEQAIALMNSQMKLIDGIIARCDTGIEVCQRIKKEA